jgi:hypothetical protein
MMESYISDYNKDEIKRRASKDSPNSNSKRGLHNTVNSNSDQKKDKYSVQSSELGQDNSRVLNRKDRIE